jgi:RNA polymerase sigma factor (TIGR02999 family)
MTRPDRGTVTRLLHSWSNGEEQALLELVPFVYRELHGLAAGYLRREPRGHTLQPTALVHEAYLRLVDQTQLEPRNRSHFFAIAANLMRQILVDHARRRRAAKRSVGKQVAIQADYASIPPLRVDVIALNEALDTLAEFDPRQSRIVELRFFGGLTEKEIAEVLGVSAITVKRDWRIAKAVLHQRLSHGSAGVESL